MDEHLDAIQDALQAELKIVVGVAFEPLRLSHSFFAPDEVMTRRFAVGHNRGEDGTLSIGQL